MKNQESEIIEQLFKQLDNLIKKELTEERKENCFKLLSNIEKKVKLLQNNESYIKRISKYKQNLNSSFYVPQDNMKTETILNEGVKYTKERTQIIFFDLEFYVPENDRDKYAFSANPFRTNHLLLGGSFLNWKPFLPKKNKKIDAFWLWKDDNDEKHLVNRIVTYLEDAWKLILAEKGHAELCLCGIGISRVDIGYLYSKALSYQVRSNDRLFMIFHNVRIIELENATIPYFNREKNMLLSKSTNQILKRFGMAGKHENGSTVWELYEKKKFLKIEERNRSEVNDCFDIYQKIVAEKPILKRNKTK